MEEVFGSQGYEPSGIAGKQIDDAMKGALQDVGIKLRLGKMGGDSNF